MSERPSSMGRRRVIARGLVLAAVPAAPLAGCALAAPRRAEGLAPGVFMLQGQPGEVDERTLGRIGNGGFIVGERGVLVVDTGVSAREGRERLEAIEAVTKLPVRLAILTHARQEYVFGSAPFRERGIPIAMQAQAAKLMKARCDGCLKTLNRVLGEEAMRGTAMFEPDLAFDDAAAISMQASTAIGRPVRVLSYGHSSGPGDTAVLDEASATLFAGGLIDHRRIPDVQDAELPGWRRALEALGTLAPRRIVPGHGPVGGPQAVAEVQRYLDRLEARLLALLQADAALSEVPDAASLPGYETWDQYAIVHRRNASILFVRMERDQLMKGNEG
ncbi:MAG TPA: MBL fold metallo-hydrolase [Methylibium sp.]|uniref:MBL fold metallo-hydrolase n=1 Tax=Methylibium sp. TaxID=2067992 RepID=UPI002DBBFD06|nr:MBL fold metallo-hydrolase [Methylibium sp.]HEU4457745.1 MBL fold metallo-hydrolase [Methylibium sp.]